MIPESPALSAEDYRIGPDDLWKIDRAFQVAKLSRQVRVNSRGEISLPLIGTVRVVGLTGQELEARLAHRLADRYLVDPQVRVFMEELISQRVTVEGLVKESGGYPLKGPATLLSPTGSLRPCEAFSTLAGRPCHCFDDDPPSTSHVRART